MLVIEYLHADALTDESFADAAVLTRAAAAIRRLHAGPRFTGDFDMFARQAAYLATVQDRGYELPAGYLDHADAWAEVRRALAIRALPTVPCNNDLLAANFIDDGERIWLIDYEYSGMNEASFELGNIASESGLDVERTAALVTAYWGTPSPVKVARARAWSLLARYGWTLWASIQDGVSSIDFDFWSWGMEKYDSAHAELHGPAYDEIVSGLAG
jgi:thiamine kinase-like enzyme